MMKFTCRFLLFALLALAAASPTRADDKVWLKNGDRITGTIVKIDKDSLVIKPAYGGEAKIPLAQIQSLESDRPLKLTLANDKVVEGKVERQEAGGILVRGAEATPVSDLAGLKSVVDPAVKPEPPDIWSGKFTFAGTVEGGNTREKTAHADVEVEGRWEKTRLNLKGFWNYGETSGDIDTRDWTAVAQHDWFLTKPLYAYIRGVATADDFQDLKLRLRGGAGGGYQFYETDELNLRGELGASWVDEDLENGGDDVGYGSMDLRLKVRYKIADGVHFGEDAIGTRSMKDGDDNLVKSITELSVALTSNLSATAKMIWEWDSQPAPNVGRRDVTYLVGVTYTFW